METVQNPASQRRQAHEKDAWKNDPVQIDRQVPTDMAEAHGGKAADNLPGKDASERGNHRQDHCNIPESALRELPCLLWWFSPQITSEYGYKGGAQGAFPGQAPNQIGNPKRQDERVGCRRSAEQ